MSAIKLMFDSGAFSAWKRGKPIDRKAYRKFLLKHREHLWCAVNLDVIPGRPGTRTSKQVEEAAEQSWANYQYLTEAGLDVMPVYHMGEKLDWLKRMVDSGASYVGLGGVATAPDRVRRPWLDEMFNFFCGLRGYPSVRVHGMGITSATLVHRYPWYSTDSISWVSLGAKGDCLIPLETGGKPDYRKRPLKVGFSKGAKDGGVNVGHLRGDHYNVLGGRTKGYVDRYLETNGFDPAVLMESREERLRINARYFNRCAKAHESRPWRVSAGLFDDAHEAGEGAHPPGKYRLVFSGADSPPDAAVLTREQCRYRLVSYFIFMDGQTPMDLESYVATGRMLRRKERSELRVRA